MALKYLEADFEYWKTSDWDTNACASYKAIHHGEDDTDYSFSLTQEEVIEQLLKWCISTDGKAPMTEDKIRRKGEKWQREVYNNFKASHNLGSIVNIHAEDLELDDRYFNIMFYSFPCTSLSVSGKGEGMEKGSGTASSLLWECERILKECSKMGVLPDLCMMENVTQVHAAKNLHNWETWIHTLEDLGYKNYYQDLNAKNYGVAQNRNRTFMISLLSDKLYSFPDEIVLNKRLKDYLEPTVDEKYYINTPKAAELINKLIQDGKLEELPTDKPLGNLTPADNEKIHQRNFVFNENGISPTQTATQYKDPIRVIIDE